MRQQVAGSARPSRGAAARAIASRALAAAVGGYLLASAAPVPLVAFLRMDRVDAVLTAMSLGFVVYTAAVMWAFAARTATRAWAGIGVVLAVACLAGWILL
ncbi:MAG: DUF3649 domain-containing protein [Comamonadaceae bacterium]|nr:MAG: DUF3649 domain-containing protein [Comamonadaceae bacterium]